MRLRSNREEKLPGLLIIAEMTTVLKCARTITAVAPKTVTAGGAIWCTPMAMCSAGNVPYLVRRTMNIMHFATAKSKNHGQKNYC